MIKLEVLRPPTEKRLPERMVFAGLAGLVAVPVAFVAAAALISAFFLDPERCGHFG
ncbi:hypothetical protein [Planomonospora venezuelensis]|uniref:Uncharacterized protein n=1 Tax=Planomonospora venezuelensis TaxID=1999 RepID=A0A841CYD0_PLAVE|nr:hypothetical protein [Planomonospora venezuelensis]MBB5962981.1 hypothetical protein [Planomonospora venezuelensis]GIN00549.1 hypothetical protein Pve01_22070 [Planomonospora venezuelensis]